MKAKVHIEETSTNPRNSLRRTPPRSKIISKNQKIVFSKKDISVSRRDHFFSFFAPDKVVKKDTDSMVEPISSLWFPP